MYVLWWVNCHQSYKYWLQRKYFMRQFCRKRSGGEKSKLKKFGNMFAFVGLIYAKRRRKKTPIGKRKLNENENWANNKQISIMRDAKFRSEFNTMKIHLHLYFKRDRMSFTHWNESNTHFSILQNCIALVSKKTFSENDSSSRERK